MTDNVRNSTEFHEYRILSDGKESTEDYGKSCGHAYGVRADADSDLVL